MHATETMAPRTVLLMAICVAYALSCLYLRWRGHLRSLLLGLVAPASLFVVFVPLDALVTLQGTWDFPSHEADPTMRACLTWGGWWGVCVGFVAWIVGSVILVDALESSRPQMGERGHALMGCAQLYTLYALAMGDLDGWMSWTHAPAPLYHLSDGVSVAFGRLISWSVAGTSVAYLVAPSLFFAAACTAAHLVLTVVRRTHLRGHLPI